MFLAARCCVEGGRRGSTSDLTVEHRYIPAVVKSTTTLRADTTHSHVTCSLTFLLIHTYIQQLGQRHLVSMVECCSEAGTTSNGQREFQSWNHFPSCSPDAVDQCHMHAGVGEKTRGHVMTRLHPSCAMRCLLSSGGGGHAR